MGLQQGIHCSVMETKEIQTQVKEPFFSQCQNKISLVFQLICILWVSVFFIMLPKLNFQTLKSNRQGEPWYTRTPVPMWELLIRLQSHLSKFSHSDRSDILIQERREAYTPTPVFSSYLKFKGEKKANQLKKKCEQSSDKDSCL